MARVPIGQRSETVRRANLSAIVRALHLRGPLSRSELVAQTGLTRSAIRGLIGELVDGGMVREERSEPAGTPGRPSPLVRADADGTIVLAVEINVDSLAAAIVGLGGTVHALVRVDRPRAHLALDDIVADLVNLVAPWRERLLRDDALVGIGVAVAGIVRRTDGLVRLGPNLGWRDEPLGARLGAALGLSVPIHVANEADLAGLAEHRRGAAIGFDSVLYVQGEVGVGGNLIVDGLPVVGVAGYAGEIGHLPVNPDGARCGCGSTGCWETEVGERAMLAHAGRPATGGRGAVATVLRAAELAEPEALAGLAHVGAWLGVGLAGLVNVLNPSLVVLGGLFQQIHPFVAVQLADVLERRALPASRELVTIVPGTMGGDAPLLGAAEHAFEPLLADPAARLAIVRARRPALASA
ncbi:MAG TPA: ROK family transcriptional regulator [Candidatus Limnocylindria bacterium]|nr:ROK family transcriptional regulator [Candidatus Limnocylindria bacterium]